MKLAPVRRVIAPVLIDRVERDHRQTSAAFMRRRIVVAVVLVIGAVVLGISLSVRPADPLFYPLTFALAATWAVGGFLSGPLHLGFEASAHAPKRPVILPLVIGLGVAALFVAGALIVREIGPLHRLVVSVLDHANKGSLPLVAVITVVNGIAEEIFFRGALFAAIGVRYPVVISTVIYALVTLASGNLMLVFAAVTLGFVLGLERRASGGILASMLTHISWSLVMLFALPPIFG